MINFEKTDLLYFTCSLIREQKDSLLADAISYHEDPVRFKRRIRLISQLSKYESEIVLKIYNFDSNSTLDDNKERIKKEIKLISDINL